jgi:hypothetical protein
LFTAVFKEVHTICLNLADPKTILAQFELAKKRIKQCSKYKKAKVKRFPVDIKKGEMQRKKDSKRPL